MYKQILIPLENSPTDETIMHHIRPLIRLTGASVILVHVADGYAARLQDELNFEDSEEITKDRLYLESRKKELEKEGFKVKVQLLRGEPANQILNVASQEKCDLIAMSTHGHRFLKDVVLGSVAETIRHRTNLPVLMIRSSHAESNP